VGEGHDRSTERMRGRPTTRNAENHVSAWSARVETLLSWLNGREGRRSVSLKDPQRYTRSESLSLSLSLSLEGRFSILPLLSRARGITFGRSRRARCEDTRAMMTRLVKSYFGFNRNANVCPPTERPSFVMRSVARARAFISQSLLERTRTTKVIIEDA